MQSDYGFAIICINPFLPHVNFISTYFGLILAESTGQDFASSAWNCLWLFNDKQIPMYVQHLIMLLQLFAIILSHHMWVSQDNESNITSQITWVDPGLVPKFVPRYSDLCWHAGDAHMHIRVGSISN